MFVGTFSERMDRRGKSRPRTETQPLTNRPGIKDSQVVGAASLASPSVTAPATALLILPLTSDSGFLALPRGLNIHSS